MFRLNVLTPEKRLVVDQEIEEVSVPGYRGEIDVLPGHAPLVTALETGPLKWRLKGSQETETVVVSWGYCEIRPDGVEILADIVDTAADVDVTESQQAIADAEKKLLNESLDDVQWAETQRDLARARADIDLAKNH